jgi:hypothetical protein
VNATDTATHRLVLLLLCDLLKALDAKSSRGFDLALIADVVDLGHRWAIPVACPELLDDRGAGAPPSAQWVAKAQEVVLRMLCGVQQHLKSPAGSEFDPQLIESFVDGGHRWALPIAYPCTSGEMEPPASVVESVLGILKMWDSVEEAIEKLPPDQQAFLKRQAKEQHAPLRFDGFDPESEAQSINVAHVYVRKLGLYPRFRTRDLYVLEPRVWYYESMLLRYAETNRSLGHELTLARLQRVLLKPGSATP